MSAEKLCLKWNGFQENTLSSYKELRTEKEFTDFTLACGDGQQVVVHKVVLIISSPLFRNLLKTNRNPHPIIIMRGVNMDDLVTMMKPMLQKERQSGVERDAPLSRNFESTVSLVERRDSD